MNRRRVVAAGGCVKLVLAVAIAFSVKAFSQHSAPELTCTLADFTLELASALATEDAGKVGLLVSYPLRVNDPRGSYWLRDSGSFQGRFNDIFPSAVRKAVTNQQIEPSNCNPAKFGYGNGDVWVELTDHQYKIVAVNVPWDDDRLKEGRIRYTCDAEPYRVIVDVGPDRRLRYRAWKPGSSLTQKPDIQILGGDETGEGTGGCFHPVWSFGQGKSRVSVEGLGCTNEPPRGATGQLVLGDDKTYWCF